MTQHGSNPDRPRGRRARPGNDWSGYDAVPQDDREFPELQNLRPREAPRHGRAPSGYEPPDPGFPGTPGGDALPGRHAPLPGAQPSRGPGQHAAGESWEGQAGGAQQDAWQAQQAGRHSAPGGQAAGGQARWGQSPASPGFPQAGPEQAATQYGQYRGPQAQDGRYGQPGLHQEPAQSGRQAAPQAADPHYGAPQPRRGRHSAAQQAAPPEAPRRAAGTPGWEDPDPDDPMMAFSERWQRRGQRTPAERRKRRRLLLAGGGVAAVAIAVLVYFLTMGGGGAANTGLGSLVTTFLPGELQQVPNACSSVSPATLNQTVPGPRKEAAPPLNNGAQSQCTWTLDSPPTYRVLEVNMTAYSPSGLASGDGSATFAAEDAYAEAQNAKEKPGPHSGQPPATVANVSGLGSSAFSASQQFSQNGTVLDMATVYVRYRNVIIQVVLNGIDHSSSGKQYGPVSQATLLSQARSVAQQVTAKVTG